MINNNGLISAGFGGGGGEVVPMIMTKIAPEELQVVEEVVEQEILPVKVVKVVQSSDGEDGMMVVKILVEQVVMVVTMMEKQ